MAAGKGAMFRGKKLLDTRSLKLVYNALVESHFAYSNLVWYGKLTKGQKKLASNSKYLLPNYTKPKLSLIHI